MNDHLDNPIFQAAIEAVTEEMARAFDEVWSRPNAVEMLDGFLAGSVRFVIGREGLLVLVDDDTAEKP